jgi:hypothetical protein
MIGFVEMLQGFEFEDSKISKLLEIVLEASLSTEQVRRALLRYTF